MNKLELIPILSILIILVSTIGIFASPLIDNLDFAGIENGANGQIIVNSATLDESQMAFTNGFLTLDINATFLEDIESIEINGVLHDKDGSYNNVAFYGNPNNGLKNNEYLLKYQSSLIGGSKDMNLDYLELTIKTTNKEGESKEIKLNITSNGTNSSDIVGNSSEESGVPCQICGKPTDDYGGHLDGTVHTDAEINAWLEKDNGNDKNNNKKHTKPSKTEKPPSEEPLPPSDDYGSGGSGGG